MTYWLSMSALIPHMVGAAGVVGLDIDEIQNHLRNNVLDSENYLLQIREVFLFVSILATLWIYMAGRVLRYSPWGAAFASALVGLSWEANYHARWIAPDAILMQWSALLLLFTVCYLRWPAQKYWGWLAAGVAGLAAGTKYTGGVLLAPVLLVFFWNNQDKTWPRRIVQFIEVGLVFALAYLATTPGTLLETREFLDDLLFEIVHYRTGHEGHYIDPGIGHLARISIYFAYVFFSYFDWAALLLSVPILLGVSRLWNSSRREFALLVVVPAAIMLIFSFQKIMSPRNLLFVAPFLAILSSAGLEDLVTRGSSRGFQAGLIAVVVVVLGANAYWLFYAAESIAGGSDERLASSFLEYVKSTPETNYYVDDWIWAVANASPEGPPENMLASASDAAQLVAFLYTASDRDAITWPLGLPKPYIKVFGPFDANLDYYPGWPGSDHILVMPIDKGKELHVPLVSE